MKADNNKLKMALLHFVFSNRCLFCGKIVEYDEIYCKNCEENIPYTDPNKEPVLHKTQSGREFYSISPMYYEKGADKAVIEFKFHNCLDYADKLGQLMADRLLSENFAYMIDFVLPVPMSMVEKSKRGYNQSLLLAQAVSRRIKRKVKQSILLKIKATKNQHNLNMKEREKNLQGAFAVKKSKQKYIIGKTLLLIDDVITTGATAAGCVEELIKAGAQEVIVLTATKSRFE